MNEYSLAKVQYLIGIATLIHSLWVWYCHFAMRTPKILGIASLHICYQILLLCLLLSYDVFYNSSNHEYD